MKKIYTDAEIEIIDFLRSDIIMTSDEFSSGNPEEEGSWGPNV